MFGNQQTTQPTMISTGVGSPQQTGRQGDQDGQDAVMSGLPSMKSGKDLNPGGGGLTGTSYFSSTEEEQAAQQHRVVGPFAPNEEDKEEPLMVIYRGVRKGRGGNPGGLPPDAGKNQQSGRKRARKTRYETVRPVRPGDSDLDEEDAAGNPVYISQREQENNTLATAMLDHVVGRLLTQGETKKIKPKTPAPLSYMRYLTDRAGKVAEAIVIAEEDRLNPWQRKGPDERRQATEKAK